MKRKKTFLMVMLLTMIGVLNSSVANAYNGNTLPTTSGDYYLYNVGTGQFLGASNSSNYGSQIDVNDIGLLLTLNKISTGVYTLSTSKSVANGSGKYVGIDKIATLWANKTALNFTFTSVDGLTNTFTISAPVNSAANYYSAASSDSYLSASTTIPKDESGYWKLVSASDRNSYIQDQASATKGVDATFNVACPDFLASSSPSTFWSGTSNITTFGGVSKNEAYNSVGTIQSKSSEYNIYQSITIPNGYYKVSCQGFYRDGDISTALTKKETGKQNIRTYLYATDNGTTTTVKTPLMSIFEGASPSVLWYSGAEDKTDYGYVPSLNDTKSQLESSAYYLLKGLYTDNEVFVKVTNESLTIGVKGDALTNATDYTVFDKFRLTYYGDASVVDTAAIHYKDLQNSYNTAKALSFIANDSKSGTVTIYGNVPAALTNNVTAAANATYSAEAFTTLQKLFTAYRLSVSPSTLINLTDAATYTPATTSTVKAVLNRTFTANQWNTICLPFAMTSDQITAAFGTGTKVAEFTSGSATSTTGTLSFTDVTTTTASTPYIIKPANIQSSYLIDGVTFTANAATTVTPTKNFSFIGNYDNKTFDEAATGTNYYFLSKGTAYKTTAGTSKIKPFRAYFNVPSTSNANAMSISVDGVVTSINNLDVNSNVATANIYNLNGQMVSKAASANQLAKGLYIMNGKKFIVK